MKKFLVPLVVAMILVLNSCATMLISKALDKDGALTPEQIRAYNEVGSSVYGCFQLGGPPPIGNMTWIVVPRDTKVTFKFGANCFILN